MINKENIIELCIKENLDLKYLSYDDIEIFRTSERGIISAHRRQFMKDIERASLQLRLFLTNNVTVEEFMRFSRLPTGYYCFTNDQMRFLEIYKENCALDVFILPEYRDRFDKKHINQIKKILKELIK